MRIQGVAEGAQKPALGPDVQWTGVRAWSLGLGRVI